MRVLVLDNYDSFTWNLVHDLSRLGARPTVVLNDACSVAEIAERGFEAAIVSPGPGRPEASGISLELVRTLGDRLPVLGVCLGHQAIAQAHGAAIVRATRPVHGKTSEIHHDGRGVFAGLPSPFRATRYHSLVVDPATLPEVLEVQARTADGAIMGLRHRLRPLVGVQFHPESLMTLEGRPLLSNFLRLASRWQARTPRRACATAPAAILAGSRR